MKEDITYSNKFWYGFTNIKGDTILKLDSAKYYICFTDTMDYFAIVGMINKKEWCAIDRKENILFHVYNTSNGEPSPDEIQYGLIRIINNSNKIGICELQGRDHYKTTV